MLLGYIHDGPGGTQFFDFVRSIDSKFEKYDMEGMYFNSLPRTPPPRIPLTHFPSPAAWPSTIDDFVEYAKGRIATGA